MDTQASILSHLGLLEIFLANPDLNLFVDGSYLCISEGNVQAVYATTNFQNPRKHKSLFGAKSVQIDQTLIL